MTADDRILAIGVYSLTGLFLPLLGGLLTTGALDVVGVFVCEAVARNIGRDPVFVVVVPVVADLTGVLMPGLRIGDGRGNGGAGDRAREDTFETPDFNDAELVVFLNVGLVIPVPVTGVRIRVDEDTLLTLLLLLSVLTLGVRLALFGLLKGKELGSTLALTLAGAFDDTGVEAGDDEIAICPVTYTKIVSAINPETKRFLFILSGFWKATYLSPGLWTICHLFEGLWRYLAMLLKCIDRQQSWNVR